MLRIPKRNSMSASEMAPDVSAYWQAYLKVLDDRELEYEGYFRRLQDLSHALFSTETDISVVDLQDTGLFEWLDAIHEARTDTKLPRYSNSVEETSGPEGGGEIAPATGTAIADHVSHLALRSRFESPSQPTSQQGRVSTHLPRPVRSARNTPWQISDLTRSPCSRS